jgi:hypothetical protein
MTHSNYDEMTLLDAVLWYRYGTTARIKQVENTIGQKMVAVQGSPCSLTPLILCY